MSRGLVLSPSTLSVLGADFEVTTYAGIQYYANGTEFSTPDNGSLSYTESRGNWLDTGDAADVWIQWVREGGTLADWNNVDAGDARLQMNANRAWRIVQANPGTSTIVGRFNFYDAASGGNLIATSTSLTFTADYFI